MVGYLCAGGCPASTDIAIRPTTPRHRRQECIPAEAVFEEQHKALPSRWMVPPVVEELKAKARALVRERVKEGERRSIVRLGRDAWMMSIRMVPPQSESHKQTFG